MQVQYRCVKKKTELVQKQAKLASGTKNGGGFSSLNMYGETSLKKVEIMEDNYYFF